MYKFIVFLLLVGCASTPNLDNNPNFCSDLLSYKATLEAYLADPSNVNMREQYEEWLVNVKHAISTHKCT